MKRKTRPMSLKLQFYKKVAFFAEKICSAVDKMPTAPTEFYDNADLKKLLKVSDSSLHRARKSKSIPFRKFGGKIYYPKAFFDKAFKF